MRSPIRYTTFIPIVFVLITATGCRTLRAPAKPYEPWTPPETEQDSKVSDTVWSSIRRLKIDTSKPLSLPALVDVALKNNPKTRQSWEGARAKQARLSQAQSELFPQVTATAEGAREKTVANNKAADINELRYGPTGKATLLLFDFGGRDASIEEAYQTILSANFQFNQAIQDLLLDVETSYYKLYSAYAGLDAAEADVADADTSFSAAKLKFKVGLVSKLDELQAKSDYDNALYLLEEAKGQVKTAKANLAKAIGLCADTEFEIAQPEGEAPTDISREDVTNLIEEALDKRPDIAAMRASLNAKEAAVKVASSELLPSISIGGTLEHNWYKYYNVKAERDDDYTYEGFLRADWDIFDGFDNYNKKIEAQAEARAQREKLAQLELEASADVWTKYYDFNTAVRKLKFSEAFFDSAKASHDLALESYGAGLKSILDLLEAQSKLSEARSRLVQSKKDLLIAIAELAHSTGSLYAKEETIAVNTED